MPPTRAIARAALVVIPVLVAFGLLAHGERTRAQAVRSFPDQRQELERVRKSAGPSVPEGALLSIEYTLDTAERIGASFAPQAELWRRRAQRWLEIAKQGSDPLQQERGKLVMRGYRSPISEHLQGYAIYVPPDYDPARAYPLLLALHGGSANGNLFLGVVLGNNMNWKEYSSHLWDEFAPRWSPQFIVVAPDGFGQVMWRFMGEQDVLDVIADVKRHYHVDEDRIVLSGLSNGGVGAYNIGMRHAHLFSAVLAIAGAPSWLQYSGTNLPAEQARAMAPLSGMQLGENALNTDFRYYHGHLDGGPMKPRFVHELTAHMQTLGVPFKETWFDTGHDLLYLVHRHGKIYADLEKLTRKRKPGEVRLLSGDYRAACQHWVCLTRIDSYPDVARVRAVASGDRIAVETRGARAFSIDLAEAPLAPGARLTVEVDGKVVQQGVRAGLPRLLQLYRDAAGFRVGPPPQLPGGTLEKKPGSSGPMTDAYYGATAHVYGTGNAADTPMLKQAAEKGAQGWPLWLWRVQQKVVADTEVTDALIKSHNLVLYATPGSNALLERIAARLPIKIDAAGVALGTRRIEGKGVGTRFIYPNPLAPDRYVTVQAAPTAAAVRSGNNMPDFLPDYVVYTGKTTASRPRLTFSRAQAPAAMGYFDDRWQLPTSERAALAPPAAEPVSSATALTNRAPLAPASPTAPTTAPATTLVKPSQMPPPPTTFAAAAETQAGQAARQIAKRVQTFLNYRARIPLATWLVDEKARWSIRDNERCFEELRALGLKFRPYAGVLTTPVPAPVEVEAEIDGVQFQMIHKNRSLLMSCELAVRLPAIAAAVKPHGIRALGVISSYRDRPHDSFHTLGLALDFWRFFTDTDVLDVKRDFEITKSSETCSAPAPRRERGRILLDIACRLMQSRKFSSVLTPNYNAGHRDHFHVDIRPDDPRLFGR